MWRSKYLRRLLGVAFLAFAAMTYFDWAFRERTEARTEAGDAVEDLTTAALALDADSAHVAAVVGPEGALSHLSLSGPLESLDRAAAEAVKGVVRADLVIAATGGAPRLVAATLEDPQALARPSAAGAPQRAEVAGAARVLAQAPILRASDGAPLGFLRVYSAPSPAPVLQDLVALAAPALAFLGLAGGIVLVYSHDRKTFLRIGGQIRSLAEGGGAADLGGLSPSGAVHPMLQAVLDLCRRHDEAASRNAAALRSELAARAEHDGMLSQLEAELGRLVADLSRGDFSQRIRGRFDFPEIQALAEGVQAMADTMETFLRETAGVLTAMAEGDLRVAMARDYAGEFGTVARSANDSIRRFRALIGEVQATVAEGLDAATRIAGSMQDAARRSNDQVAAIQETAAAMEQIATAVRSNTEAMLESDRMAQGVAASTQSGGMAARGAIAAVERIRDSSQEISAIVRVIETIAFQTTILALNSAIEAARAGEAGRGFSVVAGEVRSLAQRSSEAAKQIKTLITSSEQMVIEGVEMVQSAGAALQEIETGIGSLSARIAQVARSQIEQATAIGQVNANVANLENLAAESAALCVGSGAATHALNASMERVGAQMDRFRVEEAAAPAAAPRAPDLWREKRRAAG